MEIDSRAPRQYHMIRWAEYCRQNPNTAQATAALLRYGDDSYFQSLLHREIDPTPSFKEILYRRMGLMPPHNTKKA